MLLMKLLRRKCLRAYTVKVDIHLFSVERSGDVALCILKDPSTGWDSLFAGFSIQ
jgi:hypothetical protein